MPIDQGGGGSSGVGTGGVITCQGPAPINFPCPDGGCYTQYEDGTLDPCLAYNCACYFNWENQNEDGSWNVIFSTDPGYAEYCSEHVDPNDNQWCAAWGRDSVLKSAYYVSPGYQPCGIPGYGRLPQKGWQRLRYAPSYYFCENDGEEGNKFWFPFPIYDTDGTTPLKRTDGREYTTLENAEVSQCDCARLMFFTDTDGLRKIKINPAKGRIIPDGVSNHVHIVKYFALPNKVGSKGSDVHEHGFCIIDAVTDCDFENENYFCHGQGKRFDPSIDAEADRPSAEYYPRCLGERGIKSYTGSVYFVDADGVATWQGSVNEEDSKRGSIPKHLPAYEGPPNDWLKIELHFQNQYGALPFWTENFNSTLTYNHNTKVFSEIVANSIQLSKFYKTHCCGGSSERIANILLTVDRSSFEGWVDLPGFEVCHDRHNLNWYVAASDFTARYYTRGDSIGTDSYKSGANQYNGLERKQQASVENFQAWQADPWRNQYEYLGGAFGCRGYCGNCPYLEANIFDLIKLKLCGSKTAKLVGFGGILLPENDATPKYHVPDSRLAGDDLNDFNCYCTNLVIDPITKYGSVSSGGVCDGGPPPPPPSGSTLHRDNIFTSNDYTQGRCTNVETPTGTILPYQDSNGVNVCSDYIATTSNINENDKRCNWYWTQRFDNSSGDQTIPTAMEYHWLSGGYFYGTKELRDNVYKELGTIHFNTSVNINNFAYDTTTEDKTPKDYSIKINTATQYPDINNLWDIAQSHISIGLATSSISTSGTIVSGAAPIIKYNSGTNGYFSTYSTRSITQYVNTIGPAPSKFATEMGTGNTVTEDTNGIFVKLISSKTGSTTQWPKTDNYYTIHTPAQLSFLVDTGSGTSYKKTYYNIVNSPTTVSTTPSDTGTPVTTLEYFANNTIESSMAFITDAIPIATYENYKFFGSIINKNTIEISTGTSDNIYNNLNTKVTTTTTTKFDYLTNIKTQWDANPDAIGFLNLYNYTTNGAGQLNIVLDSTTTVFGGATISRFQIIKDAVGITNRILITLNEDVPELLGFTYGLGYSRPFVIRLNSCYSGTTTNLNNKNKESVLTENTLTNVLQYKPTFPIKSYVMDGNNYLADTEYPLFDLNSSKFSTPDYSFIKLSPVSEQNLNIEKIIPLRGAEYSTSEKQSYPTYRTIKKANGKYYLQILAGAFPYFHSVVHLPAIKGVSRNANQDSAVEESLKKVCSKDIDWYNHVATTKWTCLVKHTQFSKNLPDYIALINTKGVNQTYKPIIVGGRGPEVISTTRNTGRPIVESRNLDGSEDEL